MAVVDIYTDPNLNAATGEVNKLNKAVGGNSGVLVRRTRAKFAVAATDTAASVYRCIKGLNPEAKPIALRVANDALTNGTSYKVCVMKAGVGGAILVTLASVLDLSAAHTNATGLDGLASVTLATSDSSWRELVAAAVGSGHGVGQDISYDLAIIPVTASTIVGNIVVNLEQGTP